MKVAVLTASKKTENKLRWDSAFAESTFEMYMPKWIVPKPWPKEIKVSIIEIPGSTQNCSTIPKAIVDRFPEGTVLAIVEYVQNQKCMHTTRYRPLGDPKSWELGEPYIPPELLPEGVPKRLIVAVEWLKSGIGVFRSQGEPIGADDAG